MSEYKGYNTYEELLSLIDRSGKKYNLNLIDKAYNVAKEAHKNQKRVSGIPYILHPVSVAYILVELGMDIDSVVAALLHDVVEDTSVKKKDIEELFGSDICNLVDGVTKLRQIPSRSPEEQQAENLRKMLLAMSKDIRVIMIKLADRLQNMRTIQCMPIQKQRDKSLQNMEVYAPIAHRLGIRTIKDEIEDISLRCLDPIAFAEVESSLALCKADRENFIESIKKKIMDKVQKIVPDVYIEGRVKSANEIYKKMFIKGKNLDEIYDIYAVRVIVNTIGECYNVFGLIHDMFQPIPRRFKDYISTPKANMYQSLHTVVISKDGTPFEVQIRTWQMHRMAEYGIAAHWKYKLDRLGNSGAFGESLSWIRKLLENYKNIDDVTDITTSIKSDLVPKEIFILTPKGGVVTLPANSTVIDFAYAIHTDLGNKLVAAKVDHKMVPLTYTLKTGEIAEVITTKDPKKGPSRDWISIVKTSEARSKIKHWFKVQCREENVRQGKEKFELELSKNGITLPSEKICEFLRPTLRKNQFSTLEDFFAAVGYGGIQLWKVMPRLKKEFDSMTETEKERNKLSKTGEVEVHEEKPSKPSKSGDVMVDGMKHCYVRFAKCCGPLPGDDIIGFITKGFGVSVHKKSCKNVNFTDEESKKRLIKTSWCKTVNSLFDVCIKVTANYFEDFLANLTKKISGMNVKLISFNSKITEDNEIVAFVTVSVKNPEQLKFVTDNLARVEKVIEVKRV